MARTITVSGEDAKEGLSGGTFTPYPPGEYIMEILDVKETTIAKQGPNAKTPALNVSLRIVESFNGQNEGKKFNVFRLPAVPRFAPKKAGEKGAVAFKFYQFYKALGVEFPPENSTEAVEFELPEDDDLIGEQIGVELEIEAGTNGYADRSNARRFFPASEGFQKTEVAPEDEDMVL